MAERGIDISYWQGSIDFARVKSDGVKFVIIREGYGQSPDSRFSGYVKGCKDNGIKIRGVYHFSYALNLEQAKEEAKFCLSQMKKAGLGKDVIVFFDFEYDTVQKAKEKGVTLGRKECNAHAKAFCDYIKSQGYQAGIYSNIDYYKNMYDKSVIERYVFWLADYSGEPDYPCTFRQYSSTGSVAGIDGNVDMDYYYGKTDTKPEQPNSGKKSLNVIAKEVIAGKWGNGDERKQRLTKAGYDYNAVQRKVNELMADNRRPAKSVEELAREVIQGKWGYGADRRERLTKAGYDYNAVQNRVNELM